MADMAQSVAVFSNFHEVKQAIEEHEKQTAFHYVVNESQKRFDSDGKVFILGKKHKQPRLARPT